MICKHFETAKGCSFGDKCQFAHGQADLRGSNGMMAPMGMNPSSVIEQKKGPNPQNYKIVKCKYWEKEGTCRYGSLCTFAHGDKEMRTKSQNINYNTTEPNPMPSPNPYAQMPGMNPYMMGFDQNMLMAMQNMMDMHQQDPNQMNNYLMNYPEMNQPMPMLGQNMPLAMNIPLNLQHQEMKNNEE